MATQLTEEETPLLGPAGALDIQSAHGSAFHPVADSSTANNSLSYNGGTAHRPDVPSHDTYTASPARWWILFWYSYLSALQSLLWMTFSSVPGASKAYLHVDDNTLQLFLNEGPIAFICFVFVASLLLVTPRGLQRSVRAAAGLCFLASLLRCVPCLFDQDSRQRHKDALLVAVHIAQFTNAAVAPLIVASPSYLSLLWFPESQRNTATAIANVANAFGRAVGFFLGPAVVEQASDIPTLLLIEVGCAGLPLIVFLLYPAYPHSPPSKAAKVEMIARHAWQPDQASSPAGLDDRSQWTGSGSDGGGAEHHHSTKQTSAQSVVTVSSPSRQSLLISLKLMLHDMLGLLKSPYFVLAVIAGGLEMALYGAWSGVLPTVLSKRFSDNKAGWFGSSNTFAGIVGGLVAGLVTDLPPFRKRLQAVILLLAFLSGILFLTFAFAFKPVQWSALKDMPYSVLMTICTAAGLVRGAMDPLFFEVSAELAHPVCAGHAGSLLTFFYHLLLVVSLSIPSSFLNSYILVIMGGCMFISLKLMLPVSITYTRR